MATLVAENKIKNKNTAKAVLFYFVVGHLNFQGLRNLMLIRSREQCLHIKEELMKIAE